MSVKALSQNISITYVAENKYEDFVQDAHWQFLIIPEENDTQQNIVTEFCNSKKAINEYSINGFGFRTIRVSPKEKFKEIEFKAHFKLQKKEVNPFDFTLETDDNWAYEQLKTLDFLIDHEGFLRSTLLTRLPKNETRLFIFERDQSIFDNLLALNHWTFMHLYFKPNVTNVHTQLAEIIEKRHGVCQDFSHLFCALARENGVPTRYVSGYLNQGVGYFGDSQMHAWAECFIPRIGWIGFDPTNDILANTDHIKVAHGKDYNDCSPLKGVVYAKGSNVTTHSVFINNQ